MAFQPSSQVLVPVGHTVLIDLLLKRNVFNKSDFTAKSLLPTPNVICRVGSLESLDSASSRSFCDLRLCYSDCSTNRLQQMAREKTLRVRLSDAEWNMVQQMAESEGVSVADWLRTQIRILYKSSGLSSQER